MEETKMNKSQLIIIGVISAAVIFIGGIYTGVKFISSDTKDASKIISKEVTETEWQKKYTDLKKAFDKKSKAEKQQTLKDNFTPENFEKSIDCMLSPLNADETIETKYKYLILPRIHLNVRMYDDCKEAHVKYEIGQVGNWRLYGTIAVVGLAAGVISYHYLKK